MTLSGLLTALILLLFNGHNILANSLQERIVGGVELPINLSPWLASVSVHGNYSCSAALITSQWLVTAAHCVHYPDRYSVRAGSSAPDEGGQLRNVARILLHPSFNLRILDNDIALLKVEKAFNLDSNLQLVKLPIPGLNVVPRTLLVAGWGTVHVNSTSSEQQLRGTLVNLINQRRCKYLYSRISRPVTENMICAAAPGRDHCFGDSGAPLVHRGTSYGIVSFAHGCADLYFPGVYTRLANYVSWILGVLKAENK
ncbi:trypsin [Drosophila bipectinata]|uniref:trypsin n=1 Tax=Drosophila bipectinata TaxID=42026 RepID=UPI001C8A0987|nr:trypsin [Drosophila bipectinata]